MLREVDDIIAVSDDEVAEAMRIYFSDTHNVAEGAGAAPLAAALQWRERLAGRRIGLPLTGGNVDRALFARVLAGRSMTEALFVADATLRECSAHITAIDEAGVQLDRTVFYPQGGGQAGDAGTLRLADGRTLPVVDTRKGAHAGEIVHVLADGTDPRALAAGMALVAEVDWARRQVHMRFHTATHLLCALVPHPVDGCSITARYARLDFHMSEPLDKQALSDGIARLVAGAHAVRQRWIDEAELDANPTLVRSMSVKPPRSADGRGRVRLLDIEGVDLQPCGGTHVGNTAEIGNVIVTKVEKKSAMTRRVDPRLCRGGRGPWLKCFGAGTAADRACVSAAWPFTWRGSRRGRPCTPGRWRRRRS